MSERAAGHGGADVAIVEIRTTFDSRAAADACADRIVAGRLAACVQVEGPVGSTYRWRGAVETAAEWRCTIKTTAAAADRCIEAILAAHPYENPELLVSHPLTTQRYAAWVRDSVAGA